MAARALVDRGGTPATGVPHDRRVLASCGWELRGPPRQSLAALHAPTRRLVLASVLSFAALLFVKSLVQTFIIEHPAAVEVSGTARTDLCGAAGRRFPIWPAYERRLMQNDASAWFGPEQRCSRRSPRR